MRFAPGPDAKEKRNARQRRYRAKARNQADTPPNAYSFLASKTPVSEQTISGPSRKKLPAMRTQGAFPWKCPFCDFKVPDKGGYDAALARAERHIGGHR